MLANAVAQVNDLVPQPDLALLTGDLVDRGTAAEYEMLRELLAPLRMPFLVIPGNHDDRDAQSVLPQGSWGLSGSGPRIAGTRPTALIQETAAQEHLEIVVSVLFGADPGATKCGASARPSASGPRPTTGSTPSASASLTLTP